VADDQDGVVLLMREVGLTLGAVERTLILDTLVHCGGNRTHAAKILDISIRTLRNKLNRYTAEGMPVPAPAAGDLRAAS
jgi:two-component system response regulator FlrC